MLWTEKTQKALERASALHEGQVRKGEAAVPYVTHLVAVAGILQRHTDDEDVIVAALLHDTLEDTNYTKEQMIEEFGERVYQIVWGVTIPEAHASTSETWTKDRKGYYQNLSDGPGESAMVATADKIHNFATTLAQFPDKKSFIEAFGENLDDRIHVYERIVELLSQRVPESLRAELEETWGAYKTRIESFKEA